MPQSTHTTLTPVDDYGLSQSRRFAQAVGQTSSPAAIDHVLQFALRAEPLPIYSSHSELPFVYEILTRPGWNEQVSKMVDDWVENDANIERAKRSVGRSTNESGTKLVRAFCMFQLKEKRNQGWSLVIDGHGLDKQVPQSVVFIALSDLTPTNGFFMYLRKGEDVCVDSMAQIRFPATGGGLGVFISLAL